MGAITWAMVIIAARIRFGRFWEVRGETVVEYKAFCLLLVPLHTLFEALNLNTLNFRFLLELKLLSGFLLHSALWIILFSWCRRRAA